MQPTCPLKRTSFAATDCSVAQSLELLGEWWTLLLVRDAMLGVRRFEDFQDRLGVARNILSDRLAKLVAAGVLDRVPYQHRPPRHEYLLTTKGRDLFPVITALRQWGDKWQVDDPSLTLIHLDCGHEAWFVAKCSHCGGELSLANVRPAGRLVPGPYLDGPDPGASFLERD